LWLQALLGWRRGIRQMRQDGPARVTAGRRAARRVEDQSVRVDEHQIAAPTHRFYNEHHLVELVGGVALLALELEYALQRRLMNRPHSGVSQMLADLQTEGGISLDSARRQLPNALDAAVFQVRRQQYIRASHRRRKELDGEAELVHEHQLLHAG